MKLGPTDFAYIRDLVRRRSAMVLEPGKEYLVESRLVDVARAEGFASIDALLGAARSRPNEPLLRRIVEAMTVNETTFFRDEHPFEALRRFVLPELIEARSTQRELRIWCGAASSGQEPYSIAMLVREHFPQLGGWKVDIVGTDISQAMLERARAGRYSELEVSRGLPAECREKYFRRAGRDWQITEEIRRMVAFDHLNLSDAWPPLPLADVVFMRNVMIYFDVATKREILRKLRRVLRPGGYLFLGNAESATSLDEAYQLSRLDRALCYRMMAA